ncbi:nucleoid-associated protein [Vibrio splendidus]|uniref:nucleoid-associated protein n=1 Tax=Vibrio splendidus TaxID=29497 RepID=UPI0021B18BDC|nr:nucleoid-associated protein [Vibrio splendidus]UWZ97429.1 nucleoid-associated protein [Vibrio splendidus]
MEILNVILHNVIKQENNTKVDLDDRKTENAINDSANLLSKGINEKFNSTGLNTGHFTIAENADDPVPHFESLLSKYFIDSKFDNFVTFSVAASRYLQKQLQNAPKAKGGHIWFNHYVHQGEHFLSVVLLRQKAVMRIDELELAQFDSVDLDKLHMAARINLTKWVDEEDKSERYISFKIGKEAKKVTDYFAKFIGCEEFTESRDDTRALVKCIKAYCEHHEFEDVKTELVKAAIYEQISEWSAESNSIRLDSLSTFLDTKYLQDDDEKGWFLAVSQGELYSLNNEITPDKTELNRLKRYAGKNKDLSISFSSDLLNKSVFYNKGELTIKKIPESLSLQLER